MARSSLPIVLWCPAHLQLEQITLLLLSSFLASVHFLQYFVQILLPVVVGCSNPRYLLSVLVVLASSIHFSSDVTTQASSMLALRLLTMTKAGGERGNPRAFA